MQARILTLNVENVTGDTRRQDVLNRELRRLDPDMIALQEVVHTSERRQLDELLAGTNFQATHQAQTMAYEPPWADRYGGTAVATRWPHRVVETLDLRLHDAADVPWCTLAVVVTLPREGEVLFIATTTSWRLEAEWPRERQVIALAELDARHRRTLPTVIAGDFNAGPEAASIRYLKGQQSLGGHSVCYQDAWAVAGDGPGYTWSADNPRAHSVMDQIVRQPGQRRRIDYVFIGSAHHHPKAHCQVKTATLAFDRTFDGTWASDHFGVVVDVEIGMDA